MAITIKQGDTRHAIQAVLKNSAGIPVDLTQASVIFTMNGRYGNNSISRYAQQTSVDGEVWFVFDVGETDTPGIFRAEFKVEYADGKIETFPHSGYLQINIERNLGGLL